jgi:hypothetical protein
MGKQTTSSHHLPQGTTPLASWVMGRSTPPPPPLWWWQAVRPGTPSVLVAFIAVPWKLMVRHGAGVSERGMGSLDPTALNSGSLSSSLPPHSLIAPSHGLQVTTALASWAMAPPPSALSLSKWQATALGPLSAWGVVPRPGVFRAVVVCRLTVLPGAGVSALFHFPIACVLHHVVALLQCAWLAQQCNTGLCMVELSGPTIPDRLLLLLLMQVTIPMGCWAIMPPSQISAPLPCGW